MGIIEWVMISFLLSILTIFSIAQYAKDSKLQKICKRIARILLLGIISLSDEDRQSFFMRESKFS